MFPKYFSSLVRTHRPTYIVILVGAAIWCVMILLPPYFTAHGWSHASSLVEAFFKPLCHQLPDRCLAINGTPVAVCFRCSAVYVAFLAGTMLYPLILRVREPQEHGRWLLIAGLLPMCLDVVAGLAGLHQPTAVTRVATGSLFGFIAAFYIIPGAQLAIAGLVPVHPSSSTPSEGSMHA